MREAGKLRFASPPLRLRVFESARGGPALASRGVVRDEGTTRVDAEPREGARFRFSFLIDGETR